MTNRKRDKKVTYSVAMSKNDGCIVMVRTRGQQVEVMGSMSRDQSLEFVKSIMEWSERTIREESRIAYNH